MREGLGTGVKACFVAGTDTGVGKTLAATALLLAAGRRYPRVVGMKPVAAGAVQTERGWASEDAQMLRAASSIEVPATLYNPVLLPEPMSPHIAAARAGTRIEIAALCDRFRQLALQADAIVVEGAGGFLVPLSEHETGGDLAQALGLPVLLVVGLRLGCLNHALLTAEAIRARGLTLAGWICCRIDPAMTAAEDNVAFLRTVLRAPLLADIAHMARPDPRQVTMQLPAGWD